MKEGSAKKKAYEIMTPEATFAQKITQVIIPVKSNVPPYNSRFEPGKSYSLIGKMNDLV
jgi:hypothetical protein